MPWADTLSILREGNAFRFGQDAPPPGEGAALPEGFDPDMDGPYAVVNEGKGPDLAD